MHFGAPGQGFASVAASRDCQLLLVAIFDVTLQRCSELLRICDIK